MNERIEYENLTIRIPKQVLSYIKVIINVDPTEWIEWFIVDAVQGHMDIVDRKTLTTLFKLESVFRKFSNC